MCGTPLAPAPAAAGPRALGRMRALRPAGGSPVEQRLQSQPGGKPAGAARVRPSMYLGVCTWTFAFHLYVYSIYKKCARV